MTAAVEANSPTAAQPNREALPALVLGALGVVFGDIGTSPLYALKEALAHLGLGLNQANVYGVLSLLAWTMTIVVSIKYALIILRADNRGEGGILVLLTVVLRGFDEKSPRRWTLIALALFGASLFYGDSVITPAISVLSAVEGLEIAIPNSKAYVIPITLAILTALFVIQRHGTSRVGKLFGPITVVWFLVLGLLGLVQIAAHPQILTALNPWYAIQFAVTSPHLAFGAMGAIVLAVTGAEALYADMGHFGRPAIRYSWYCLVMPALLLNYFGQGALVLANPEAVKNPFFLMAPSWATIPLVILAATATVIASQAVISGAFSMTASAIHLGYAPRMQILHTSEKEKGQIYMPFINWSQFIIVVLLVVGFKNSSALAGAYGIAVSMTMLITSILVLNLLRVQGKWPTPAIYLAGCLLFLVDVTLVSANSLKIADGGWFPLILAGCIYLLLITWKRGRSALSKSLAEEGLPLDVFVQSISAYPPHRVEGTAVFMNGNPKSVPHALLHNLKHNKILHERVIFLTLVTRDIPYVPPEDRIHVEDMGAGFYRMEAYYGFKDEPDVQGLFDLCEGKHGMDFDMMQTSFFLARETVVPSKLPGMALWREHIFAWMSRNAMRATDYFRIPPNRVVELGTQIEI